MRTFGATIKEKNGSVVEPTFMADNDFWKWHEPKAFLAEFWGLANDDVEEYVLYEYIGKERREL